MKTFYKIAIIGGTGKAGSYIVNYLLNKNVGIKLLTRNPKKVLNKSSLIEIIHGNVVCYESVLELCKDCQAIISVLGADKGENELFSHATNNLISVMNRLKIKRFITVSGITINAQGDKKSLKTKLLSKL